MNTNMDQLLNSVSKIRKIEPAHSLTAIDKLIGLQLRSESGDGKSGDPETVVADAKAKAEEEGSKTSDLEKELENTCKCPSCGFVGSKEDFKVKLVNAN
ncbi:hypothetical protein C3I27_03425 [Campylobacter jejuni]|uniref:Uncharacterized protein n=1 Tax=Campylobacter jejuni TaxID=197 RepID=A0A431EEA1_CAMJU|nr:hypothetical protein [Campylobacter jejuni]RTI48477.1 hypothetical protein C3I27_03425 [Campylobacter jejuni]RTJ79585.1 hypothetical protein C3H57_04240 [Campylobacter jejuni]HEG8090901.1 hypothetical protein [Campylobacter jejuni]HEG8094112.1 hypothetical protein [Campylobacter jejuni]HEG8097812.1 hypothetical protein [Campylobacter jejuni]